MSDTTAISALPSKPSGNISLETKEIKQNVNIPRAPLKQRVGGPPPQNLNPETVNKIVTGIQNAAQANMTSLPTRDMPMMPTRHTQDVQVKPNFVPQRRHHIDYIKQHDNVQEIIEKQQKKEVKKDRLETIYNEVQTPIFVMILYLLFQLPAFQKLMNRHMPALFSADGHPKMGAFLIKTILFGGTFYFIQKGTKYLSELG